LVLDSVADLCDTSVLLHQVLPTNNRDDDTPLDIDAWSKTHA
jgi:NagD protein